MESDGPNEEDSPTDMMNEERKEDAEKQALNNTREGIKLRNIIQSVKMVND